jgi:nitroreductase
MEILEAISTRRSIRKYSSQPVSDETVEQLLRAAMAAPSAANEQPWQFVVIRDHGILNQVPSFHPHSHMLRQAALAILVCEDPSLEVLPGRGHLDCSNATQNILLAAHSLGLGAVWLGIYPVQERMDGMRGLLGIPPHIVPISLVSIGYPDQKLRKEDRYKPERVYKEYWEGSQPDESGRQTTQAQKQPAGTRPSGPLHISGMMWLAILFVTWIIFWVTFDIQAVSRWFSIGIPAALSALTFIYRSIFNKPAWMEIISLAFFAAAGLLSTAVQDATFLRWGSILGTLVMALMWLVSLAPPFKLSFSAEYSKWGYARAFWVNSRFIQPNMAVSLVWGWQFILAASLGIASSMLPGFSLPLTILRNLLLVPAAIFTFKYLKGATSRSFADVNKNMSMLRAWSYAGLAIAIVLLLLVVFALKPSA